MRGSTNTASRIRVRGKWWHYQFELFGKQYSGNTGILGIPENRKRAELWVRDKKFSIESGSELLNSIRAPYPRTSPRWQVLTPGIRIPAIQTCYVLCSQAQTFYVGQTGDLYQRIHSHGWIVDHGLVRTKYGVVPGWIKYRKQLKFGERLSLEAKLIRKLRPPLNRRIEGRIDLRREVLMREETSLNSDGRLIVA